MTLLFAAAVSFCAQEKVDAKEVDKAIERGIAFLRQSLAFRRAPSGKDGPELVLWTFIHARVPEGDPDFQTLLKEMLKQKLTTTYRVSLRAMILEALDRVKYQEQIYACAQFLLDNQNKQGNWSYGKEIVVPPLKKRVATGKAEQPDPAPYWRRKPEVKRKIRIKRQRWSEKKGDNSNSQYAMLGIRACHDAGISLPSDLIKAAEAWWRSSPESARSTKRSGPGVA